MQPRSPSCFSPKTLRILIARAFSEVAKYMEKYKDSLAAANGGGTAVKPRRGAARKAVYRPPRVSHAR